MDRPTGPIDPGLMVKAASLLLTAFATFGSPGDDPYDVARIIALEAKLVGFSETGLNRLLVYAYSFVDELRRIRNDPLAQGTRAAEPRKLFGSDALGGLFDTPAEELHAHRPSEGEAEARDRALIEQLIVATRLYETGDAVRELMAFTSRLRDFAPFNAMLLHIQKPGLTHAASAADWWQRFRRVPKPGTRPMLILRAMGPVDFVFDILDTEGEAVPDDAFTFPTFGNLSRESFDTILGYVRSSGIELAPLDRGDAEAGWIGRLPRQSMPRVRQRYQLGVNKNHPLPTQLVTIAHELAHLYLGHLGEDEARGIRDRTDRTHSEQEVEAEITAYLVAKRNGLSPRSETYLNMYQGAFGNLDLYGVMRAANAVETAMGISAAQLKPH